MARQPSATTLLHALGRPGSRAVIDAFCARGGAALRELLRALLDPPPPLDLAEPVNGRAVFEEEEECLVRLAVKHPRIFVWEVRAHSELLDRLNVLSAVGRVPGKATTEWLLEALTQRWGTNRWLALTYLLDRNERRVVPKLSKLLADRDGLVAFVAIQGFRRWGTPADVPALLDMVATGSIGAREAALDAIETICARSGDLLPAEHPGARLETVATDVSQGEVDVEVTTATQVTKGKVLARWDGGALKAPCDGVVSAIDLEGSSLRIMVRRTDAR
ncbi:MAG: hypothetical protein JRI68_10495 [Deltaproteobacteria bacterium]|nr:hypothetical protein [Deltaproteobacteria bacterium]